ncbi:MAG: helix-turn-helix transcriptional regulator [Pseudomonadota bacterium]
MQLEDGHIILLIVSLCGMLAQLTVKHKKLEHLLFAILCGSIAMSALAKLSVEPFGYYHYLIGMGATMTCNGAWLLSRAMFRTQNTINTKHVLFALSVAVMLIAIKAINFYSEAYQVSPLLLQQSKTVLIEMLTLFSSAILLMTFWEGCNGWSRDTDTGKRQRLTFLVSYSLALCSVMFVTPMLPEQVMGANTRDWFATFSATFTVIMLQCLLLWRSKTVESIDKSANQKEKETIYTPQLSDESVEDSKIKAQLMQYLVDKQMFLQANLKVVDVAHQLKVSEYRISRIIATHCEAENFNQLINAYRVKYAKQLLKDPDKQHWPIVVVGLESGFASVGPFNRAFKKIEGCTPGQFRKHTLTSQTEQIDTNHIREQQIPMSGRL